METEMETLLVVILCVAIIFIIDKLLYSSTYDYFTTVKSSKSNSNERFSKVKSSDRFAKVKSSKSNSSERSNLNLSKSN